MTHVVEFLRLHPYLLFYVASGIMGVLGLYLIWKGIGYFLASWSRFLSRHQFPAMPPPNPVPQAPLTPLGKIESMTMSTSAGQKVSLEYTSSSNPDGSISYSAVIQMAALARVLDRQSRALLRLEIDQADADDAAADEDFYKTVEAAIALVKAKNKPLPRKKKSRKKAPK